MINSCISQMFQEILIEIFERYFNILHNYIHQTKSILNIPFESNTQRIEIIRPFEENELQREMKTY